MHYNLINDTHVPYLRNKYCVAIWCFASSFFDSHRLHGFATGMFISDMKETPFLGVSATWSEINLSRELFTKAYYHAFDYNDQRTLYAFLKAYKSDTNNVIKRNRELLTYIPRSFRGFKIADLP